MSRSLEVARSSEKLTRADKNLIRQQNVEAAEATGSYAYSFAWDGEQLVEMRVEARPPLRLLGRSIALPPRVMVTPVDRTGKPTGESRAHFTHSPLWAAVPVAAATALQILTGFPF